MKYSFLSAMLSLGFYVGLLTYSASAALIGDIDNSGRVDGKDLAFIARHYNQSTNAINYKADLNQDGIINTNDFALMQNSFGHSTAGGAAAWISTPTTIYKTSIDGTNILSVITGFDNTPNMQDINPDTGELWVIPSGSDDIYVISPFVPSRYDISTNTGFHYTYHVPGAYIASLAPGNKAFICTAQRAYLWQDFPQDYVMTNDTNRSHCKEFLGFININNAKIFANSHVWIKSNNKYFHRVMLNAPDFYNVTEDNTYSGMSQFDGMGYGVLDSKGDLIIHGGQNIYNLSPISMGIFSKSKDKETILSKALSPDDDSVWFVRALYDLVHLSPDYGEILLQKKIPYYTSIEAVDSIRKNLWMIQSSYRQVVVYNYLANQVFSQTFNEYLQDIKLFLPKINTGYPVANVSCDILKGPNPLTVNFSATNSYDSDGTIIDYAWDFDGDGLFDIQGPDKANITHTFDAPGAYPIMMQVTDDDALKSYDASKTIGVGPLTVYPTASVTSGVAALRVDFDAQIMDGLGNGYMQNYQWDFNDDGLFDFVSLDSPSTSYTYAKAGSYTARIKVLSAMGDFAEASLSIDVAHSRPTITTWVTATIPAPQTLDISVNARDEDGTIVLVCFDFDQDGIFEYVTSPNVAYYSVQIPHFFSKLGNSTFNYFVVDDDGNHSTTNSNSVALIPDNLSLKITPATVNAIGSVTCQTIPIIISNTTPTFSWSITKFDRYFNNYSRHVTACTSLELENLNSPGIYKAELSQSYLSEFFTVYNPNIPIAKFRSEPSQSLPQKDVTFDASDSYAKSGIATYAWQFDAPLFYDDAEVEYNSFFGDIERSTQSVHQGSYAFKIPDFGSFYSHILPIPSDKLLYLSFYGRVKEYSGSARLKFYKLPLAYQDFYINFSTNWQKYTIPVYIDSQSPNQPLFLDFKYNSSRDLFLDEIKISTSKDVSTVTSTSSSPVTSFNFPKAGEYIVNLCVTDNDGNKSRATSAYLVEAKPAVFIQLPTPSQTCQQDLTFYAVATLTNSIYSYKWDFNNDGVFDKCEKVLRPTSYFYENPGLKTASLTAELYDGSFVSTSVVFTVEADANIMPKIFSSTPRYTKHTIPFNQHTLTVASFGNSTFQHLILQDNIGHCTTNINFDTYSYIQEAGIITQNITVVAMNGLAAQTQVVFTALAAHSVEVSARVSPNPARIHWPVNYDAAFTYHYSTAQSFAWDFEGDGIIDYTSTNSPQTIHTYDIPGQYYPTAYVTATNGFVDRDIFELSVIEALSSNDMLQSELYVYTPYYYITNIVSIAQDGTISDFSTNNYGYISSLIVSPFDGSIYLNTTKNYDYSIIHLDHQLNFINIKTNSTVNPLSNNNFLFPCLDSDGFWYYHNAWTGSEYIKKLNHYDANFELISSISNALLNINFITASALPNNQVCVADNDYLVYILDSDGKLINQTPVPNICNSMLYNPGSTSIWLRTSKGIYIYNLNLEFQKYLPYANCYPNTLAFNPLDNSCAFIARIDYNTNYKLSHFDAWGNIIADFVSPSCSVLNMAPDIGGYNIQQYRNTRSYSANFTQVSSVDYLIHDYSSVPKNPIYYSYAYGNRPYVKGSYSVHNNLYSFDMAVDSPVAIKYYQWDFDGDGTFDFTSDTTAATTHQYLVGGNKMPVCRIVDINGIATTDSTVKPILSLDSMPTFVPHIYLTPANGLTSPCAVVVSANLDINDNSDPYVYCVISYDWYSRNTFYTADTVAKQYTLQNAGDYTFTAEYTVNSINYIATKTVHVASPKPVPIASYLPSSAFAPVIIQLDAASSYTPGGSIDLIQWDVNNDGIFDNSSKKVTDKFSLSITSQAVFEVRLRAYNQDQAFADTNMTITVNNSPPVPTLSVKPDHGIAPFNSLISFDANDPDGLVTKFLVDIEPNGSIDYSATAPSSFVHVFTNLPGSYSPTLYAIDNHNATSVVDTTVTILAPNSPLAIASASPKRGLPPLNVALTGICSNQIATLYEWDLDGDGSFEWNSSVSGSLNYIFENKGKYNLAFRVTSTNGLKDTAHIELSVGAFPIPQPRAMPLQSKAPQTVKFVADGYDPDGTILYFWWDFNNTGTHVSYNPITDSPSTFTYYLPGVYTSSLIAQDDSGLIATNYVTITILPEDAPAVSAYAIPDNVSTGKVVNFYGLANDSDGTITSLKWLFGDGSQGPSLRDNNATHVYSTPGFYTAKFIATDNDLNISTAKVFVTVFEYNAPAIIAAVTPTAGDSPLTVAFTLSGSSSASPITEYMIDFDDGSDILRSSNPIEMSYIYNQAGTFYPQLIVVDGNGLSNIAKFAVSVGGYMNIAFDKETFDPALGEELTANIILPFDSYVTLNVLDQYGVVIKNLLTDTLVRAGLSPLVWDGKDNSANFISDGTYYFVGSYVNNGTRYIYDPSYDVPGLSSPSINRATVENVPFKMFSDNPLMIGYSLSYRSEMTLFMAKNPTGRNVTPYLYNRVKTIYHRTPMKAGSQYARWDTTDDNGNIAVDPFSAADFYFYIWNWQLPVNSVIIKSKPVVSDVTFEGEPNYFSGGINPYDNNPQDSVKISFSVSKPVATVAIIIMKFDGAIIRALDLSDLGKGYHEILWDGKSSDDIATAIGEYKICILATDDYGNVSDPIYNLFKLFY